MTGYPNAQDIRLNIFLLKNFTGQVHRNSDNSIRLKKIPDMNRSTFILGIALLVVALTMAVTVTVRNAPDEAKEKGAVAKRAENHEFSSSNRTSASARPLPHRSRSSQTDRRQVSRERYQVVISESRLSALPVDQQEELRSRVGLVESKARKQLERMTQELELTTAQRNKMFPLLVRSANGYDPAMQVVGAGAPDLADSSTSTDDEIHALLDPEQQAQLEDEEVNRRLWWQDLIGRLEKDLDESTGGSVTPTPPARPTDNLLDLPANPSAPPARPTGNLLDPSE